MSRRVGLRKIRGFLGKILRGLGQSPFILRIYIVKDRWIISALYSVRLRDRLIYQPLERIQRSLEEASKVSDAYSTDIADRIERSLEESALVGDAYNTETATKETRELEETSSVADGYSLDEKARETRELGETATVGDAYNTQEATLLTFHYAETAKVSDSISRQIATREFYHLKDIVKVQEVSIPEAPWEDDPSKLLRQYYIFEKALADDIMLWYYTVDGRRHGGYYEKGVNYVYEAVESPLEDVKAADAYVADVFTEWWQATKYDGYTEADVIYNFSGIKYDGYVESSVAV